MFRCRPLTALPPTNRSSNRPTGDGIQKEAGRRRRLPARRSSMAQTTQNQQLREEFNRWADSGRGEGMEQDHLPITLPVLERMQLSLAESVLDVGCGAGWLLRQLAGRITEGRVVGIDVSDARHDFRVGWACL